MPVSRERQRMYPGGSLRSSEWLAIRAGILERAGHRCEGCGVPDRAVILKGRTWEQRRDWCLVLPGTINVRTTEVVLTIAHVDQDPANNDPTNLKAWCQLCHITHDAPHKAAAARERHRLAARGGAPDLFDEREGR